MDSEIRERKIGKEIICYIFCTVRGLKNINFNFSFTYSVDLFI
jgi:hypothetical protein